jgi:hypothetical protein
MSLSERWNVRALADDGWIRVDFGPLRLLVMNTREEWRVASLMDGAGDGWPERGRAQDAPEDIVWQRWDHDPKDTRISFRPAFPGMPVVARPHSVLNLSPKGEASFFVGIPAWIEIMAECQGEMMLLTGFPTEELSKTWHGTPLVGSLGYALRTYARRVFEPEVWPEFEILCPIGIVNDGEATLPFERLYLETDHLSVFEKDGRLWSNAARIHVASGDTDLNNITYAPRPAAPNQDAEEITLPRKGRARQSTMRSTFTKVLGHFNPLDEAL